MDRLFFVLVIFLSSISFGVDAQNSPNPNKVMKRMDENGDGRIEREEWQGPPPAFGKIDSDNDGFIEKMELRSWFGGRRQSALESGGSSKGTRTGAISWIDVHVHPIGNRPSLAGYPDAVRAAVEVMDQNHISHMVLMSQPQVNRQKRNGEIIPPAPIEEWINEARKYPDRFVVLGGGGSLNSIIHDRSPDGNPGGSLKKTFVERAEELVRMGVVGFGELSVMHLALVDNHAFEDVPADHPLFLMLADISAKHEMIIDIHFDPVLKDMPRPNYLPNGNPAILKRNIEAFDRLLAHNRKARFSWAHAGSDNLGFWTAEFSKEMLRKHPNLYMSLRMTKGRAPQNHPLTMNGIKDEWMEVFKAFPDRFFLGGDQFILGDGARGAAVKFSKIADPVRKRSRRFLSFLPENLARKIGYENAVREYKIADTSRLVKR